MWPLSLSFFNLFSGSEEGAGNESVLKVLGGMVMSCYAKYWIYVCGGMFIMVSFAGKLVGYKIIYMLLFLICLCLYQVETSLQKCHSGPQSRSVVLWNISIFHFVLVQMFVVICTHIFQIKCQFLVMTDLFVFPRCTILCGGVCWSSSGGSWWPIPCWCWSPSTLTSLKISLDTGETVLVSQKSSKFLYKSLRLSGVFPFPAETSHCHYMFHYYMK